MRTAIGFFLIALGLVTMIVALLALSTRPDCRDTRTADLDRIGYVVLLPSKCAEHDGNQNSIP